MRASRAYSVYNRAAGARKLTSVARPAVVRHVLPLARGPRRPHVRRRRRPRAHCGQPGGQRARLGSRTLEEVPLEEVAELIRRIHRASGTSEAAALKRALLDAYALVRLTARADEYLGLALDVAEL